jgi:hypothetical protein
MLHQHSTVEGPQHVIIAKSTYRFSKHITISFDVKNTRCFTIEKTGEKYLQLKCTYFGYNFRNAEKNVSSKPSTGNVCFHYCITNTGEVGCQSHVMFRRAPYDSRIATDEN